MGKRVEGTCQLCGVTALLVEAHIFPQAIAKQVGSRDDPPRSYSVDAGQHPKRLRTGWYDPAILCERCDGESLGRLDTYGVEFLRASADYAAFDGPNGTKLAVRPAANPETLKLFGLSILWRAAVSRRPEFAAAALGPFQGQLRDRLLNGKTESIDDFATMIVWCPDDPGELIAPPWKLRLRGGARAYAMHLASHTIVVKVDSRPAPPLIRPVLLDPAHEVVALVDSVTDGVIGRVVRKFIESDGRNGERVRCGV